jgi:hypothetical protein
MKREKELESILAIMTGFLVIYFFTKWDPSLIISIVFGLTGITSKYLSSKISLLWLKSGHWIGFIVSKILLTLIFFFILFPLSLISKIFRRDPLMLSGDYESYFVNRDEKFKKNSFEKTW